MQKDCHHKRHHYEHYFACAREPLMQWFLNGSDFIIQNIILQCQGTILLAMTRNGLLLTYEAEIKDCVEQNNRHKLVSKKDLQVKYHLCTGRENCSRLCSYKWNSEYYAICIRIFMKWHQIIEYIMSVSSMYMDSFWVFFFTFIGIHLQYILIHAL